MKDQAKQLSSCGSRGGERSILHRCFSSSSLARPISSSRSKKANEEGLNDNSSIHSLGSLGALRWNDGEKNNTLSSFSYSSSSTQRFSTSSSSLSFHRPSSQSSTMTALTRSQMLRDENFEELDDLYEFMAPPSPRKTLRGMKKVWIRKMMSPFRS